MLSRLWPVLVVVSLLATGCAQTAQSESGLTLSPSVGAALTTATVSGRSSLDSAESTTLASAPSQSAGLPRAATPTRVPRLSTTVPTPTSRPIPSATPAAPRPALASSRVTFAYYVPDDP